MSAYSDYIRYKYGGQLLTQPEQRQTAAQEQGFFADNVDAIQMGALQGLAGMADFFGLDETGAALNRNAASQVDQMSTDSREAINASLLSDEAGLDSWVLSASQALGNIGSTLLPGLGLAGSASKIAKLGETGKKIAGLSGVGLTGGGSATGSAEIEAKETVREIPMEELRQSEMFQEKRNGLAKVGSGLSDEELDDVARDLVIDQVELDVKTDPALLAVNFGTSILSDGILSRYIGAKAGQKFLDKITGKGAKQGIVASATGAATRVAGRASKTGLAEAGQEFTQDIAQQDAIRRNFEGVSEQVANRGIDVDQALNSAAAGFAGGAPFGVMRSKSKLETGNPTIDQAAESVDANISAQQEEIAAKTERARQESAAAAERQRMQQEAQVQTEAATALAAAREQREAQLPSTQLNEDIPAFARQNNMTEEQAASWADAQMREPEPTQSPTDLMEQQLQAAERLGESGYDVPALRRRLNLTPLQLEQYLMDNEEFGRQLGEGERIPVRATRERERVPLRDGFDDPAVSRVNQETAQETGDRLRRNENQRNTVRVPESEYLGPETVEPDVVDNGLPRPQDGIVPRRSAMPDLEPVTRELPDRSETIPMDNSEMRQERYENVAREQLTPDGTQALPDRSDTIQMPDRRGEQAAQEQAAQVRRDVDRQPLGIPLSDTIFAQDLRTDEERARAQQERSVGRANFVSAPDGRRARVRANGNAFATEKSVRASKDFRDAQKAGQVEVVQLENGFGWRFAESERVDNSEASAQRRQRETQQLRVTDFVPTPESQPEQTTAQDSAPQQQETQSQSRITEGRQYQVSGLPVEEAPLEELTLSDDVPQFKEGANKDGVVEKLGGKFDRTGVAPIQVWVREDGRKEVISGRHRLDLAKRSGETTIPAQYHYEAEGFGRDQAAALDAVLNIRDGQGKVKDYVQFIKSTELSEQEADAQGILGRAKGRRAYDIATKGTDTTHSQFLNDGITEETAHRVSTTAPNNDAIQAVGLQEVLNGASITQAEHTMRALLENSSGFGGQTGDMFGFDDSALQYARDKGRLAAKKVGEMRKRLSAIRGAAKNPKVAKEEGIDIRDQQALQGRISEIEQLVDRWQSWQIDPELSQQLDAELRGAETQSQPAPETDLTTESTPVQTTEAQTAVRSGAITGIDITEKYALPEDTRGVEVTLSDGSQAVLAKTEFGNYQAVAVGGRGTTDLDADNIDSALEQIGTLTGDQLFGTQEMLLRTDYQGTENARGVGANSLRSYTNSWASKNSDGDVTIEVLATPEEGRRYGLDANDGTKGAYDPRSRKVLLIASNLDSMKEAKEVLRHEVLGHHGLRNVISKEEMDGVLNRIMSTRFSGNRRIQDAWRTVEENYAGERDLIKAEEVFALLSEQEPSRLGDAWSRVVAAIKSALRKVGLLDKNQTSPEELQTVMRQIARGMKAQRADNQTGMQQEPAFLRSQRETIQPAQDGGRSAGDFEAKFTGRNREVEGVATKEDSETAMGKIREWFEGRDLGRSLRETSMKLLTLRQFSEVTDSLYGGRENNPIRRYQEAVQSMMTDRESRVIKAGEIADDVAKLQRKHPKVAEKLYDLMNDATLFGLDPDRELKPEDYLDKLRNLADKAQAELDKAIAEDSDEITISELRKTVKEAELTIQDFNESGYKKQQEMRRRWNQLPDEAKDLYRKMRDIHVDDNNRYHELIKDRIEKSDINGAVRKNMVRQIQFQQELQNLRGPYFPLSRFGDFVVEFEFEGERMVYAYESSNEAESAANELQKDSRIKNVKAIRRVDRDYKQDGASFSYLQDLFSQIQSSDLDPNDKDAVTKTVYQLYLKHLPERSMRKNRIQRRGVKGYSNDALRGFATVSMKNAYQLSRLGNMDALNDSLREVERAATNPETNDPDLNFRLAGAYQELKKRHDWTLNPQNSKVARRATAVGFLYMLGVSPAAAVINLVQTFNVAVPVIASRTKGNGVTRGVAVAKEIVSLMNDFVRDSKSFKHSGFQHNSKFLSAEEQDAFERLRDTGVLDRTNTNNLLGLADEGAEEDWGSKVNRVAELAGTFFHSAEVMNREVTAIAAYRAFKKDGMSHDEAVKAAGDVVWDSHFDYTNVNRAPFMQSNFAKVALQFKQYAQQMTFYLGRNFLRSLGLMNNKMRGKPVTQEQREGATQLLGTLAITAAIGGTSTLPAQSMMYGLANMIQGIFGDEDEPFDAETEVRMWLADTFGKSVADTITYGAFGAGLSQRITMDNMWFHEPWKDPESSEEWWSYWTQSALGPLASIGVNALYRGPQLMAQGEIGRGFEAILPKFAKDPIKAFRYYDEGAQTLSDATVKPREDFSVVELSLQALGLSSADVSRQYAENRSIYDYDTQLANRRQSLLDDFYRSYIEKDERLRANVLRDISRFNERNPQYGINAKSLKSSIKSRVTRQRESVNGVYLSRNRRYLAEELDYTE